MHTVKKSWKKKCDFDITLINFFNNVEKKENVEKLTRLLIFRKEKVEQLIFVNLVY